MERIYYGNETEQFFDVYQTSPTNKKWILLVHGGYWRQPYNLDEMYPMKDKFLELNYNVVNIEYRKGENKWPIPKDDVENAITTFKNSNYYNNQETILIGHSAGGQLVLLNETLVDKVVGLAPVTDLVFTNQKELGDNAVYEYFGAVDNQTLQQASPINKNHFNSKILVIHGTNDDTVLVDTSVNLVNNNPKADIDLFIFNDLSHSDCINPNNKSFKYLITWI